MMPACKCLGCDPSAKCDCPEVVTDTQYDDYGNVVQVGTSGSALAAGSLVVQQYAIDDTNWQLGLLVSRIEYADEAQTQILRQDRFTYDPVTRQVATQQRWDNVAGRWLQTQYAHDSFGNLISSTDPTGSVKNTVFEAEYNTFPISETVSPSAGTILTQGFCYEPAFGRCTIVTDPAGAVRSRTIDGLGRTVAEARTSPDGTMVEVTRFNWTWERGMLCQQSSRRLDWAAGTWTTERNFVDGLGRTVRTERDPAEGSEPIVVETSFNARGLRLTQDLPFIDSAARLSASWTYDAFGRVVSATTPAANGTAMVTTTAYPAVDTVQTTVAVGTPYTRTTTIRYGIAGGGHVPLMRQDNAGGVTTYVYDGLGHLLSLADPAGIVTNAAFDTLGRQVKTWIATQDKTISATSITYNDLERTAVETAATGSLMLVRDGFQRVIEKRTGSGAVTQFVYDEADMPYAVGRLSTVELPSGDILRYGYDADGNVSTRHVTIDGTTSIFEESFGPDGLRQRLLFPDGSVQTNSYGPSGKLSSVDFAGAGGQDSRVLAYSGFDAFDNPANVTLGNGVSSLVGYDAYGRLASMRVTDETGSALFVDGIERAPTDAVVALGPPSVQQQFGYDPVGRLQSANGGVPPVARSYAYDLSGNCVSSAGTQITYEAYSPVTGVGADPFVAGYDDDGSLVRLERDGQAIIYEYDDEQQLLSVGTDASPGMASFTYDHAGRRLTKTENGIVTWYVGPEYEIVRFTDGSIQHSCIVGERGTRDYIVTTADHGSPAALAGVPALGVAYFICDHLHSVRVVLDAAGAVCGRVDYDPFGAILDIVGTTGFRYSFSGREFDQVARAYYFGARYYDPRLQRFLTPDDQLGGRLTDRDTCNTYAYVSNDPASLIDLTGHSWGDFIGQVVLDVAAVTGGVALLAVTGGAANIGGSTLIGAGIGGLAYDIKAAATGKGGSTNWVAWGIQVGIGAATGLLTGGVAVGAGSALTTAGIQGVARGCAIAGIMAVTGSGVAMSSTAANNAISGTSLTSGLGMAGVSGAVIGLMGGGLSVAMATAGASSAAMAGEEAVAPNVVGGANMAGALDDAPGGAIDGPPEVNQPAVRPYWRNFKNDLYWKMDGEGNWNGFSWAPVHDSSPRLIFGSLRSIVMSSMPDFGKTF